MYIYIYTTYPKRMVYNGKSQVVDLGFALNFFSESPDWRFRGVYLGFGCAAVKIALKGADGVRHLINDGIPWNPMNHEMPIFGKTWVCKTL